MGRNKDKARAQKVDHGGRFFQWPHDITRSVAYRSLSCRARAALLELTACFNGYNNGRIGLSIDNLSAALGNQNHRASSLAIAELMDRGFVECMANANHVQSKAREYRLTFVSTGEAARDQATNEWRSWTPPKTFPPRAKPFPQKGEKASPENGNMEKIVVEATATPEWKPVEATATQRKFPVEATATQGTETRRVGGRFHVEATAAHIGSQYQPPESVGPGLGNSFLPIDELRVALNGYLATGTATATDVCKAIDLPAGTMSKFRAGRGLPESYRGPLHWELGKRGAFTSQPPSPVNQIDLLKKSALAWLSSPGGMMSLDDILIHGAEAFAKAGGPCWTVPEPSRVAA